MHNAPSGGVALGGTSLVLFCFICYINSPLTRKPMVSLYFGREVCTRLGVAFFEVYGPPVFHIKVGRPVKQANLPAYSPRPPLNAECQAGKLRMPFFKVFWYDSTRGMNPWSTDCEANALTTTPSRRSKFLLMRLKRPKPGSRDDPAYFAILTLFRS